MPFQDSPSHALASAGIERRFLGLSRHAGTGHAKRPGEVWLVFYGDWTGVHRIDPRDRRTVFLERAMDGDRRAEALRWALDTFAVTVCEPTHSGPRVPQAANSAGVPAGADAAGRRASA